MLHDQAVVAGIADRVHQQAEASERSFVAALKSG